MSTWVFILYEDEPILLEYSITVAFLNLICPSIHGYSKCQTISFFTYINFQALYMPVFLLSPSTWTNLKRVVSETYSHTHIILCNSAV